MRMTLNDIGKALRKVLSAVARAAWGITLCAGGVINPLIHKDMAKRKSKTAAQQCRFYEVDNIFEYMVETYINGNFSTFREIYKELCKDARKDFIDFLLSEVEPIYWREILKETI